MVQTSKGIHVQREIKSWDRKDSIPESMKQQVTDLEALMQVLSDLPEEWVSPRTIYNEMDSKQGANPSKRTIRRWINKLQQEDYVKTRGTTRNREIFSLVDGKKTKTF